MSNWYYYDKSGTKVGPITATALKALAQQGRITPETAIENQGGRVTTAGKVSGLEFPPSGTPMQPPPPVYDVTTPIQPAAQPTFESPLERLDRGSMKPTVQRNTNTGSSLGAKEYEQIKQYFTSPGGCLSNLTIMKDDAYDQMVMDKVNGLGLKNRAIEKIGLDIDQLKEIPPVFLHGYSFEAIEVRTHSVQANAVANATANIPVLGVVSNAMNQGVTATYVKFGTDGRLRTSKYDATWLFFSNTQIYMYKYTVDMASNSMKETILEYFYKDITNFSTQFTSVSPPPLNGCQAQLSEGCFGGKPKVRENYVFMIVVPGDEFTCSISGVPDAEKSVHAMKQLMREKKG